MFSFITKLFNKKPTTTAPLAEGDVRHERKPSSLNPQKPKRNPQKPKRNPPAASSLNPQKPTASTTDSHVQNTYMFTDVIDDSHRRSTSDSGAHTSLSYDCGSSCDSGSCSSSSSCGGE